MSTNPQNDCREKQLANEQPSATEQPTITRRQLPRLAAIAALLALDPDVVDPNRWQPTTTGKRGHGKS
jgi:hypothetical protein